MLNQQDYTLGMIKMVLQYSLDKSSKFWCKKSPLSLFLTIICAALHHIQYVYLFGRLGTKKYNIISRFSICCRIELCGLPPKALYHNNQSDSFHNMLLPCPCRDLNNQSDSFHPMLLPCPWRDLGYQKMLRLHTYSMWKRNSGNFLLRYHMQHVLI